MMQNLNQLAQLVKGRNPEALVMQMIQNNNIIDPDIQTLVSFAQKGDTNSTLNLATTMFAKRGLDFNSEFNAFLQLMK